MCLHCDWIGGIRDLVLGGRSCALCSGIYISYHTYCLPLRLVRVQGFSFSILVLSHARSQCVEFSLAYFSCSLTLCRLYGCVEQNILAIPHSVIQKYRHLTVIYRVPNIYQALMQGLEPTDMNGLPPSWSLCSHTLCAWTCVAFTWAPARCCWCWCSVLYLAWPFVMR